VLTYDPQCEADLVQSVKQGDERLTALRHAHSQSVAQACAMIRDGEGQLDTNHHSYQKQL
jgi:cellobiose-specific phosphotransferase system component IIA